MPQNTNTVTDVENLIMSKTYLLAKYIFGGLDGKSEYIFGENRMFIWYKILRNPQLGLIELSMSPKEQLRKLPR